MAHLLHRAFHALHREVISNSTDEYSSPHVALATTVQLVKLCSVGHTQRPSISSSSHGNGPMVYLCTAHDAGIGASLHHRCRAYGNRTWLGMQRVLPRMWSEPHEHAARTSSIGSSRRQSAHHAPLRTAETSPSRPASERPRQGQAWFPTVAGLAATNIRYRRTSLRLDPRVRGVKEFNGHALVDRSVRSVVIGWWLIWSLSVCRPPRCSVRARGHSVGID